MAGMNKQIPADVSAAITRLIHALEPLRMDSIRIDHSAAAVHCTRSRAHLVLALRSTEIGTYWHRVERPGAGKHAGVQYAGVASIGDEYAAAAYVSRELPYRPDMQPMVRGL